MDLMWYFDLARGPATHPPPFNSVLSACRIGKQELSILKPPGPCNCVDEPSTAVRQSPEPSAGDLGYFAGQASHCHANLELLISSEAYPDREQRVLEDQKTCLTVSDRFSGSMRTAG